LKGRRDKQTIAMIQKAAILNRRAQFRGAAEQGDRHLFRRQDLPTGLDAMAAKNEPVIGRAI
jgi:hypothetical protein